jgi:hypothetical protein
MAGDDWSCGADMGTHFGEASGRWQLSLPFYFSG